MDEAATGLAGLLTAFTKKLTPLAWATPVNLAEHQAELTRRLISGDDSPYTTPFPFPEVDGGHAVTIGQEVLSHIALAHPVIRPAIESTVLDGLHQLTAIRSRDDDALNEWSMSVHGVPQAAVVATADGLLPVQDASDVTETRSVEQFAVCVRDALDSYGLTHWSVQLRNTMSSAASVLGGTSAVRIRTGDSLPVTECRRLLAHEVGGHVLRWENARRQQTPWAQFAFDASTSSEEGLAALTEEELGVSTAQTLRTYAVRVKAVVASRTRNLLELAFYLGGILPAPKAASLTLRIRRGLSDPGSVGGLTKDHSYLTGLLQSRELATQDPQGLKLIRSTKWPIGYLPIARELAGRGELASPTLVASLSRLGLDRV